MFDHIYEFYVSLIYQNPSKLGTAIKICNQYRTGDNGGGVINYSFMSNMKLLNSNKELLDLEGSLGKILVHKMCL